MPFASAVTYFQEHDLDLNRYLQPHPLSTYFLRMEGNALSGAGICSGDILVVDRSRNAAPGCLIIAELNGELLARRPLREDDSFAVWGVVTSVIRKLL